MADRSVEGSVFADGLLPTVPSPVVQEFVERYRKRFQATPLMLPPKDMTPHDWR